MPEKVRSKGKLLVVEDEAYVRDSLAEMLVSKGYDVSLAGTAEAAVRLLERASFDVVLTDLKMSGGTGLDLIREVRSAGSEVPIIVLTGFGTISSAVACMRSGASDYILKPADPDALDVALQRALSSGALRREVAYLRSAGAQEGGPAAEGAAPIGVSPGWKRVVDSVAAAASSDATVLLLGESGTGKELLARMIHRLSPRAAGPYVRVNCAAVPIEMWESEFFGHRKGSFTGATADREGRFRVAHRGTLFMDEVGAMAAPAQAKILRVLQDGEFDRLGDEQPTRVDVRIVAATNSDLDAEVAAGRFRQDLFYRLNVVRIDVPALRDRMEDIPLLARRFAAESAARRGRPTPEITEPTLARMMSYSWPGNVRELRNVIERALILAPGPSLALPDLPATLEPASGPAAGPGPSQDLNLRAGLGRREKEIVQEALRRSRGVRSEAARLLGIDPRNLGYYLRKHGIDPDRL